MTQEMLRFFHLDHVRGVVVVQVMKKSPGARAGLKTGDVILSLDKHEVNDKLDYGDRVSTYPVGNVIGLTVLRDGKEHSVSVKVAVLPTEQVVEFTRNWLGLDVSGLQSAVARSLGFTSRDGVVVTGVVPNSAGGKIGIKPGDVIRQVNQTQINTEEDFKTAMVEAAGRDNILFLIQRGRNGYYVTLEP